MQGITLLITDRNGNLSTFLEPTDLVMNVMGVIRSYDLGARGYNW